MAVIAGVSWDLRVGTITLARGVGALPAGFSQADLGSGFATVAAVGGGIPASDAGIEL
jgi:hypothetical protein